MSAKYLLVTRIGPRSLHRNWLRADTRRDFDVVLSAYDTSMSVETGPGVHFEHRAGPKVAGYGGFLTERSDLWKRYEHVCLWDEDLETDAETLNEMFGLCAEHRFKIAQPALTPDSHFTYAALVRQPAWTLRHVNFVEMMCPVFRTDVLERISPLFRSGYESGIDLVWCNLAYETRRDFAVIDATAVRHTEAVGKSMAANGFVDGRRYEDDIRKILDEYAIAWLGCVPSSALTPSGKLVTSRSRLFLSAVRLLAAVPKQSPIRMRLRAVLVHLKHLATRRSTNVPARTHEAGTDLAR